jgi:hypothetical protein
MIKTLLTKKTDYLEVKHVDAQYKSPTLEYEDCTNLN